MKLIKWFPVVALLASGVAHAEVGKISSAEEVGGKMCAALKAQLIKQQEAKASPVPSSSEGSRDAAKDSIISL